MSAELSLCRVHPHEAPDVQVVQWPWFTLSSPPAVSSASLLRSVNLNGCDEFIEQKSVGILSATLHQGRDHLRAPLLSQTKRVRGIVLRIKKRRNGSKMVVELVGNVRSLIHFPFPADIQV
jgi:hypothetical protein